MLRTPSPIKQVFQKKQSWWRYFQAHEHDPIMRPVIPDTITRILACGTTVLGYASFHCSNTTCSHTSIIPFGCKSRFCNTCGKKRTDQWIEQQKNTLPHTSWQHVVFTIPGELWPLFDHNRHLLGQLSALAAKTLLKQAKKKGLTPAIFTAIHTFGRDLKWNVHIHLSITCGGLTEDHEAWKKLTFHQKSIMPQWRHAIITLLRENHKAQPLTLPDNLLSETSWEALLNDHYNKHWIVHFAKPTKKPIHTIQYLGRYISRPPLAMSRLKHYDGNEVIFQYLDHTTKTQRQFKCSAMDFIERLIKHIPDKGFRMIRYYGVLANRVRGALLPKVRELLGQPDVVTQTLRYPQLLKASFGLDPLACILCQSPMMLIGITVGKSLGTLYQYHEQLALMKLIH